MNLQPQSLLDAVVVAVVFIVGSARVTRLFVADTLPPIAHLRAWYEGKASGGWETLLHCPWCFSVWVVFINGLVGLAALEVGGLFWMAWFVMNFLLAASYVAGWIVFHDEDGN